MNAELPLEAESHRLGRLGAKRGIIPHGKTHAVDRRQLCRDRRDHEIAPRLVDDAGGRVCIGKAHVESKVCVTKAKAVQPAGCLPDRLNMCDSPRRFDESQEANGRALTGPFELRHGL